MLWMIFLINLRYSFPSSLCCISKLDKSFWGIGGGLYISFSMSQIRSIGFKSRPRAGQCNFWIPTSWMYFTTQYATCGCALSCIRRNWSYPMYPEYAKTCSSRTSSMYRVAVRRLSKIVLTLYHPRNSFLPKPLSSLRENSRNLSPCHLLIRSRPSGARKAIRHSFANSTRAHNSRGQLECSRANRSRAAWWCLRSSGSHADFRAVKSTSTIRHLRFVAAGVSQQRSGSGILNFLRKWNGRASDASTVGVVAYLLVSS